MTTRTRFNSKRRIVDEIDEETIEFLVDNIQYKGSPLHKSNPGDFGLTPPASPRPHKSLCDKASIFKKLEAQDLLKRGVKLSLVSPTVKGRFPKNIWSMTDDKIPLEAQLENEELGEYHGYPLPEKDPFRQIVLAAVQARTADDE